MPCDVQPGRPPQSPRLLGRLADRLIRPFAWLFGYRDVPLRNRITFRVDFQSQLLWAAMMCICQPKITQVIAQEIMHDRSAMIQAVLQSAAAAGSLASFLWAWLATGRSTLRFIIIPSALTGAFCIAVTFVPASQPYLFCLMILGMFLAYSGVMTVRSAVWHMSYARAGVGNIVSRFQISDMALAAALSGLTGWLLTTDGPWRHVVPIGPEASYRVLFSVFGVCGILGGVLCMFSPDRGGDDEETGGSVSSSGERSRTAARPGGSLLAGWRILRLDRAYRQFLGWMMVFGFGTILSDTVLVMLMGETFQSSSSPILIVIYLVLLPMAVQMLTMPFAGRMLDRTNPMRVRVWGAATWSASRALLFLAAMTGSLPLLLISQLFSGIGGGLGAVAWQLGHMHFARKDLVQQYMGLHISATGLRGLVAPFLAVMLWDGWAAPAWLGGWHVPAIGAMVFAIAMVMQVIGGAGFWWMDHHYKTLSPLGPDVVI